MITDTATIATLPPGGTPVAEDYWDGAYSWQYGKEGEPAELELADGRRVAFVLRTYY